MFLKYATPTVRMSDFMVEFNGTSSSKALSHSKATPFGCGCFFVFFFGIFFLIGTLGTILVGSDLVLPYLQALSWTENPCTITQSQVDPNGHLNLEYEYTYLGKQYTQTQYDAYESTIKSRDERQEIVNENPVGKKTVCYVNSDEPQEAILSRQFNPISLFALIPMLFAAVGLIGMIAGPILTRRFSNKIVEAQENAAFQTSSPLVASVLSQTRDWQEPGVTSGPQELKSDDHPKRNFIICLLFSMFWCGIVSIFVFDTVSQWMQGEQPWMQTLFMTPFVLIGLGGLGGSVYLFLKIFNPVPKLVVSERAIPLGETIRMKWIFDGQVSSIRKMTIHLVGTEWIQYRRGTSTYTDTDDFYTEVLVEITDPMQMEMGEVKVTIPAETMHSFHAVSNRIQWKLQIKGDIARWPDVDQSFGITVLPKSLHR